MTRNRLFAVLRILAILGVIFLAWSLRLRAARLIPIDYDEDDYMRAGQEYAQLIRTGNWAGFMDTNYRPEHPPLAKIAYGLAMLAVPEQPLVADVPITAGPANSLPDQQFRAARREAAFFGTLAAALLALVNPLGGLMLAIHTFTIKYTSQVMLDGLAALLSLSTVLAYVQYKRKGGQGWLVASAILLGLAADTKFLHGTVGFAILLDWLYSQREALGDRAARLQLARSILLWGVIAVAVFFAFNPYLWPDPIGRIQETLAAVRATTTSPNVESAGFPAWQPLTFLSMSVPYEQNSAFVILADTFIALLAVIGFGRMWKKESAFGVWLAFELLVLVLWRTKWPQYILVVTAPLALAAGEGLGTLWQPITFWWQARRSRLVKIREHMDTRRALPWLIPGLLAFALLTLLPLIFQFGVSMTDFNTASIRDGFTGGLWRALWGGLTGHVPVASIDLEARANQVNYTGLSLYPAVFDFITRGERWSILFFNIMWTLLSVVLQLGLGLGVALLLWQRGVRLGKFWQALFILPWAIPEMIGALMWANIFQRDSGWLALASAQFGPGSIAGVVQAALADSPSLWLLTFLLPAMWYGFPFMMLSASVGLKSIPKDVFDAAAIDGASPGRTFRYVTWPLLLPLLLPAMVVRGIFAFNQFYLFQVYGFGDATLAALSYNVFNPNNSFGPYGGQFALSAVLNILTVLFLITFVILFNRWSKADEGVTYA